MPTSRVTDILRAKDAVFFIAALIAALTMESRSAEVIPPKPDQYFNDYAGVVSKKAEQFEDRIDSSRDSAFVGAILKVRLDDRRPGETVPQQHRGGGASAETPTIRTTVVSPVHQEEREPATPGRTSPVATATEKPVPDKHHVDPAPSSWFFINFVMVLIIVIALIVISMILRRGRSPKPPSYPLLIAIKFKSGGGKLPQQLDGWQALLEGTTKALAPLRLLPLFESLNSNRLSQLIDRARRNDPKYEPPDFSAWFQVETPAGVNADELVKPLRELANIETAYVIRPSPPPVPLSPKDDRRNLQQHYQDAAPNGIDARYAWGFLGGDGAGIGFVDLEQGWNLNHRDLKDAKITIISGINLYNYPHGTSVLGVVLMVDNAIGGVGIAPSASGRVMSEWNLDLRYKTADAIAAAVANMSFGDVLLVEVQIMDPAGGSDYWPAEIFEANYIAIEAATAAGIVVVEAAGNGGHDLDRYVNASGQKIFNRSSAGFRDSGAIMVSAGSSLPPHDRLSFSNHGNRIDCYGWGENIVTTTTSDAGGSNTMYRTDFDGTSGASAIVAGAALIMQGIAQAALGRRFSPRELRDLLKTNGTPSATPADRIGVMPDLRAIITDKQLNLVPVTTSP